jgi:hypothetical protein
MGIGYFFDFIPPVILKRRQLPKLEKNRVALRVKRQKQI